MVSLRFPFSFSPPAKPPVVTTSNVASRSFSTAAVACSVAVAVAGGGIAAGIATPENPSKTFLQNALNLLLSRFSPNANHSIPMWCSLSLADNSSTVTESKTGFTFPSVLKDTQRLLGVGLRKKSLLGLKNIDVYAFGVYAGDGDVKKLLSEKKQEITTEALMESDINLTVRLQIVYGRLSIRSVRSAFEESVGSRLQKFGGSDNKELLQRFTSQFKDEYKIPRGSIIDLSRERGHVLRTIIDGKEVGSIESKVLCRSVLDLYIGNDPFDPKAKKDVEASLLPS